MKTPQLISLSLLNLVAIGAYSARAADVNVDYISRNGSSLKVVTGDCPFVEADYLELNPDVAQAVKEGTYASGRAHYDQGGKNQNRRINKNCEVKKPAEPIESYIDSGTGLGYRVKNGTVKSSGAFATIRVHGYQAQDEEPLLIGDASGNFNVFNKDQGTNHLSTEFGGSSNMFIGYSFNKGERGVDFLVGMGSHISGSSSIYSTEKGQIQGAVGPETGIHVDAGQFVATLTGSVSIGGESCTVTTPDGSQIQYNTNAVGFSGIGRILVSDRVYLNVYYIQYPMVDASTQPGDAKSHMKQGATTANATLFWNIGDKISLSGNCMIHSMDQQITTKGTDGADVLTLNHLDQSQFSIGIIRRFGK